MLREILKYPDKRLNMKSKPVEKVDDEARQLIDDMFETMYNGSGIGLAAPQVDERKRVIIIDLRPNGRYQELPEIKNPGPHALINPKIISSEGKITFEEGCLSLPDFREEIERADKVRVKALDRDGKEVIIDADGLLAVALQHEIDHLDGILAVNRVSSVKRSLYKKKIKKAYAKL
jgi:peptide deformylase